MKKFGKILKYEFIANGRILLPIYGVILLAGIISGLMTALGFNKTMGGINAILIVANVLLMIGSFFVTAIYCAKHFSETMSKQQAYLTHTLPVDGAALVVGNYLVHILFVVICGITVLVSLFLTFGFHFIEEFSLTDLFGNISDTTHFIKAMFASAGVILTLCTWILSLTYFENALYMIFSKYKKLFGALIIIANIVFINVIINYSTSNHALATFFISFGTVSILQIAATAVVFQKRINLE